MTVFDTPPPLVPAAEWTFPDVSESRLDNGLRVLAYHCPGQHVIAASLLFDVPLSAERRDREGVAALTGRCLTRGAAGSTADEFADALALCGADLDAAVFPDGFAVRLAVPSTHLSGGLGLLADAVARPAFSPSEVAHERRLRLQEIAQARAYPQHVAVERMNAALFDDTRAGRLVGGGPETVEGSSRDDVADYHRANLRSDNATLIIAGDFGVDDPRGPISESLSPWRPPSGARLEPEEAPVADQPQLILVDWPDAPQATVRVAGRGITRADSRWPAMFVANFAVGGNFSSRINSVLREDKGLTYGASSSLDTGRTAGLLSVSTAVRGDAAAEAVADILAILRDAFGSITEVEVETAIRAVTDSAALGFERADAVVGRVELLVSQRLPLDHVDANLCRIRKVTTEAANGAYSEVARPDAMAVIVVGDAASLRSSLADLGHAELVTLSPPAVRPAQVSPDQVNPDQVSPDQVSPAQVSPAQR